MAELNQAMLINTIPLLEAKDSLKTDLDRYAALHAQTYDEAVDTTTLIPHMLEAFMAGDRGFWRVVAKRERPQ